MRGVAVRPLVLFGLAGDHSFFMQTPSPLYAFERMTRSPVSAVGGGRLPVAGVVAVRAGGSKVGQVEPCAACLPAHDVVDVRGVAGTAGPTNATLFTVAHQDVASYVGPCRMVVGVLGSHCVRPIALLTLRASCRFAFHGASILPPSPLHWPVPVIVHKLH